MSSRKDRTYVTMSVPKSIGDEIDFLIEKLGYWPSRSAFAREACLEKIRREKDRKIGHGGKMMLDSLSRYSKRDSEGQQRG